MGEEVVDAARTSMEISDVRSYSVILLGVVALAWYCKYKLDRHALYGNNRGPKIYPIVGCQFELMANKGRFLNWIADYIKKDPGHTIRVERAFAGGRCQIFTGNPANVEYILKTNFDNYPKGETTHKILFPFLGDGIFNADHESWKSQRKLASVEFSTKSLRLFLVEVVEKETLDRLLPLLSSAMSEGKVIDIHDLMTRFALDNICNLIVGHDPRALDPSFPEMAFSNAIDEASKILIHCVSITSPIQKFLKLWSSRGKERLDKAVNLIDDLCYSIIQSRKAELLKRPPNDGTRQFSEGKTDLLSRFIQLALDGKNTGEVQKSTSGSEGTSGVSDVYIRDMVVSLVIAGKDTSSATLTWFFWFMSKHPQVAQKIRAEVLRVIQDRIDPQGGVPSDLSFNFEELKDMDYLQAALQEALRLYPPVPMNGKMAFANDVLPDGTIVHKNDRVTYSAWAMGRLESLWGQDCLEYKPERWFHNGMLMQESPFKFPVFQAGPRICLGREMALTQMKYIVASLMARSITFKVVPENFQPRIDRSFTLKFKDQLLVTVEEIV
ncbi:hypothetical protein Mapa_003996 [Marchantia paleacea]|nr:hypothetical protein Mapa_003996 [Marchantia paleacea]